MSDPRAEARIQQENEADQSWQMAQAIARSHEINSQAADGPTEAPVNTDVPAIMKQTKQRDGDVDLSNVTAAAPGDVLACTTGNWEGEPTDYSYQWRDGQVDIANETESTYTVIAGNTSIDCVVTATNAAGSTAAPPSNKINISSTRETRATTRR